MSRLFRFQSVPGYFGALIQDFLFFNTNVGLKLWARVLPSAFLRSILSTWQGCARLMILVNNLTQLWLKWVKYELGQRGLDLNELSWSWVSVYKFVIELSQNESHVLMIKSESSQRDVWPQSESSWLMLLAQMMR